MFFFFLSWTWANVRKIKVQFWNAFRTKLFGNFLIIFGIIFYQLFDHFLDHFWEPFWGPLWDQIGQRGGKMSPREPSGASKNQKAAFSKTSKNLPFLKVFGSGGLPREPQETQEGSQEEPKELQNPQKKSKKLSKSWLKMTPKMIRKFPKSLVQKGFHF